MEPGETKRTHSTFGIVVGFVLFLPQTECQIHEPLVLRRSFDVTENHVTQRHQVTRPKV